MRGPAVAGLDRDTAALLTYKAWRQSAPPILTSGVSSAKPKWTSDEAMAARRLAPAQRATVPCLRRLAYTGDGDPDVGVGVPTPRASSCRITRAVQEEGADGGARPARATATVRAPGGPTDAG